MITGFLSIMNRQSSIINNKKGFTLIELAIVMVIIGLILGAVMKGQDLIQGARAKKFIAGANAWTSSAWTYVDRKGKFAGDGDRNGIIGDEASDTPKGDLDNASFANPPTSPLTLGGNTFYMFFGNDGHTTFKKNILLLCTKDDCNAELSTDDLLFADALDTAIDGVADGTVGQVRCTSTAPTVVAANWLVGGASPTNIANPVTCNTSAKGIMYYFDRTP